MIETVVLTVVTVTESVRIQLLFLLTGGSYVAAARCKQFWVSRVL
jgi:hypothetical protein